MVRVACIGDLHGRLDRFHEISRWLAQARPQIALFTGDLSSGPLNPRGCADVSEVLANLDVEFEQLAIPFLFVPGNHDPRRLEHPSNTDRRLTVLAGARIYGIGGAGPATFGFPYEWSDAEIGALEVPEVDILLAHTPPLASVDYLAGSGIPAGSLAIRNAAANAAIVICGHIHEGVGVEMIGPTLVYNPGSLGAPFGRCQVGEVTLSIDSCTVTHRSLGPGGWSEVWSHRANIRRHDLG